MGAGMDGLLLRSLQIYIRGTFGAGAWHSICHGLQLAQESFEPLLRYDSGLADRVARAAADHLARPVDTLWEDLGTYLVTHPANEGVRRLLRFGGVGFADFLHSLEELPGRARLALPDLDLPDIRLAEPGPDQFDLWCRTSVSGVPRILVGILTAMADDYGALCVLEAEDGPEGACRITVRVLDNHHCQARRFDLALPER